MNVLKMPCFVSVAWQPGGSDPEPKREQFEAIWDTGATNSVITQAVVDKCGLAQTGRAISHGIHGEELVETYLVSIVLPNRVRFRSVPVTKGKILDADMVLGMDIIGAGDFSVPNTGGITKFSYRTPSIEHIDYAEQARKIRAQAKAPSSRADRRRKKFGR